MRLRIVSALVLAAPAVAGAQTLGIGVRAGYTFSSSFTSRFGNSGTLQGPEFAVDVPIGLPLPINGLGGVQFLFSPSIMTAQGGWSLTDFQGTVYRVIAGAKLNLPNSPVYFRVGAGFAYATSQDNDFASVTAYETQWAIGVGLLNNVHAFNLSAEVAYHQSSAAEISGWTIGLAARF